MTADECIKYGGHCWESDGLVLASLRPQYPEHCKHCAATRVAIPRPPYSYRYPEGQPS